MYSIDTSALVDGWVRYYPQATFPKLWVKVEDLIAKGLLRASKEVLEELQRQDDGLHKWAKAHLELFIEADDAVQGAVVALLEKHANPDKPEKGINGADPFVIGLAMTQPTPWAVVSGEKPGTKENPKIPYVCDKENLRHLDFLGLIQDQRWKF